MNERIFEFEYDAGKKHPTYEDRVKAVKILYGEKIANFIKGFYENPENRSKNIELRLISKREETATEYWTRFRKDFHNSAKNYPKSKLETEAKK